MAGKRVDTTPRIMWLLNHTSARKFEIPMLKRIGFSEIFLPKSYPQEHNFRSASVDFTQDGSLTIPKEDLQKLNAVDWYKPVSKEAWQIANKYFDVAFFIAHDLRAVASMARNFAGALIWRAYGLDKTLSYSQLLSMSEEALLALHRPTGTFLFGYAYKGIENNESDFLASKGIYLPLGLSRSEVIDQWTGADPRILFVCPEIGFNPYYKKIYEKFTRDFAGLPYLIGGAQPIAIHDPHVLGFVEAEEHAANMKNLRVMFYHSQEPRHIHYHPFEAIRAGMPLIFMAGGLLDKLGGADQPGRAKTVEEARIKIERLLKGDQQLLKQIRSSQPSMLNAMTAEHCEPYWRAGFAALRKNLQVRRSIPEREFAGKRRVAVIVPVEYRGGSLRAAKLVAEALSKGSKDDEVVTEIIFGHVDSDIYTDNDFKDLPREIQVRPFSLKKLDRAAAERAMKLRGFDEWRASSNIYITFDDEIKQLLDCDMIIVISDRVLHPILPIYPVVHVIYDYLQRYSNFANRDLEAAFLDAAHRASKVIVTTEFTREDAINYAGLPAEKVVKLPMLSPCFSRDRSISVSERNAAFIWTTNANPHKNHRKALEALAIYYEEMDGKLRCNITGVRTKELLTGNIKHLKDATEILQRFPKLQKNLVLHGDLPDSVYQAMLAKSQFLWHPGLIDNGTFSVVEAASLGVPSLSSNYPAMQEMNNQFSLSLEFMDPTDSFNMAEKLKYMEENISEVTSHLPHEATLYEQSVDKLARKYWEVVSEWL